MKNKIKLMIFSVLLIFTMILGGCGNDDKVVMITTENIDEESTAQEKEGTAEISYEPTSQEQDAGKEEATAEEKNITIEQIYKANYGDKLLTDCTGYSVNTIYYSNGTEIYWEFKYLGFDETGNYMQAYEDSDGCVKILDNYSGYYYLVEDDQISTLIYPEEGVLGIMINYTHNNLVVEQNKEGVVEAIRDVYREGDFLVVETDYVTALDDEYVYKYCLDDEYKIKELYCYFQDELLFYTRATKDAVYNEPENITQLKSSTDKRIITIKYPAGDGFDTLYQVPSDYPISLELFEYSAYLDEACTKKWTPDYSVPAGDFTDEVIYLKK